MNKICCIYAIKDKRSDKVIYIGETVNFKNRKKQHFCESKNPIDKYMFNEGRDNFKIYIFQELNEDISKEEMRNLEQIFIDKFDTHNNGLNVRNSGNVKCKDPDAYNKDWYIKNKEYMKEYQKEWRENHKNYWKQYNNQEKINTDTI